VELLKCSEFWFKSCSFKITTWGDWIISFGGVSLYSVFKGEGGGGLYMKITYY